MAKKKNSGSAGTLPGTGKDTPAASGAAYHQKKRIDAIWGACREAQDADASRKAQEVDKLRAAATRLGFTQDENGEWIKYCPHCRGKMALLASSNGDVRACGFVGPTCAAIPGLQRWLRDAGFQS